MKSAMEMKMTTYTDDKLSKHLDEMKVIVKLHYKESRPYEDIPLEVNWKMLIKLNDMGVLKFYTMKEPLGKLIGYATFMLHNPMEYSSSLQASMTNIFLHPNHRGNGGEFISWCDEQLKKQGVQVVYHHVKAKNDYGVLLKRLGYDIMNLEYSKRLDK